LAYERLSTEVPRQFIIVGTTNSLTGYLKDFSGSRRFWPVRIEKMVDAEGLARDRDQLWAEASVREAGGSSIRLAEDLWELAGAEQEKRRLEDPWEETLRDAEIDWEQPYIEANLVWDALQMFAINARNNQHSNRISEIMQRFGYAEKRKIWIEAEEGVRKRAVCWVKPGYGDLPEDLFEEK
jgi:predicted P-loop ATPase